MVWAGIIVEMKLFIKLFIKRLGCLPIETLACKKTSVNQGLDFHQWHLGCELGIQETGQLDIDVGGPDMSMAHPLLKDV